MIFTLLKALQALHFHVPQAFFYSSTRMVLAALTALVINIALGPFLIRKLYEMKIGQPIRKEDCPLLGELHAKKEDTPTMGGMLLYVSVMLSLILWMDLQSPYTWILGFTSTGMCAIGAYDDYLKLKYRNHLGIKARYKLLLQVLIVVTMMVCILIFHHSLSFKASFQSVTSNINTLEVYQKLFIPFFKTPWTVPSLLIPFSLLLSLFVIVGVTNGVNLTDGLDGLAVGTSLPVIAVLSTLAFLSNHVGLAHYLNILYIEGASEIAIFLAALFGSCLGFLWYNSYPAQIFMGDTGSLFIGGVIGVSAFLMRRELLLALLCGVFLIETLSVIIQVISFKLVGKRVFLCSPLHHHYEYKGYHEVKIVVRFCILSFLLAALSLLTFKLQ